MSWEPETSSSNKRTLNKRIVVYYVCFRKSFSPQFHNIILSHRNAPLKQSAAYWKSVHARNRNKVELQSSRLHVIQKLEWMWKRKLDLDKFARNTEKHSQLHERKRKREQMLTFDLSSRLDAEIRKLRWLFYY